MHAFLKVTDSRRKSCALNFSGFLTLSSGSPSGCVIDAAFLFLWRHREIFQEFGNSFLPRRRQDYPLHRGLPHVIRKILERVQTNQYQSVLGRLVVHRKVALCFL